MCALHLPLHFSLGPEKAQFYFFGQSFPPPNYPQEEKPIECGRRDGGPSVHPSGTLHSNSLEKEHCLSAHPPRSNALHRQHKQKMIPLFGQQMNAGEERGQEKE